MAEVARIDPETARRNVKEGRAVLVCAYEDEEKCRKVALDGAMTLKQFEARASTLPRDRELIFYCA
jgi:hypothetical protein